LIISFIACSSTPRAVAPPGPTVVAKNVSASPGVGLVSACTPSGPELCFNAIDDNCNGIIEEGCGVPSGPLQFVVAWGDSPADIDISLTAPNHEKVQDAEHNDNKSGFHMGKDCPNDREACQDQNLENIYFNGDEPPKGHYVVEVKLVELRTAETPVHVRFGARVGARTFGADLLLTQSDDKKTFAFDL
jgi:tRNA (guanosine-2'-O-)-methyltransferase